ncbi:Ig-like domain repeat protein [Methanobrevibacter sp.]
MILLVFLVIGTVSATEDADVVASDDVDDSIVADGSKEQLTSAETDVEDSNFTSLDTAIQNVDAGGTVHLNTNVTLNDGSTGEEITYMNGMTISKDLTINGYNQTINATDANGNKVRLFTINSGAHVTLNDLTIAGAGYTGGGSNIGAAITVNGGSLILNNVHFIDNYAQLTANTKVGAGAIMVYGGGSVDITGGSFINNTIKYDQAPNTGCGGAAINVNQGGSTVKANGTLFENNEAIFGKTSNSAGGGAISSLNGFVMIANSQFVNNRVTFVGNNARGGAIYAIPNGRASYVVNCTFKNNSAHSVAALYMQGTSFDITGCIFEDNTAPDSTVAYFWNGGNVNHNAFTDGKVTVNNYVTEESNWWGINEPDDVGLTLSNWIVMTMEHDNNHIIVKLTSLNDGTTLANAELLPEMEATVTGLGETRKVKLINGVGTLELDEGITAYAGNTIEVTVASQSFSFVANDVIKSFAELENNIANTEIGGTYDVKGEFQLNSGATGEEITYAQGIVINKNITIDGHGLTINATDANGNKVRIFNIKNGATVTLKNIILTGGSSSNGGAIIVDDATLTLNEVTFTENTASNGGAVYSDNGIVNIVESTFINNTAINAGAVQISNGVIEGSIFEDNSASQASAVSLTAVTASANYNIFFSGQSVSGTGNFDYNWWKTNSPENVGVTLDNWIVMNITNDDKLIKFTLNTLNNGVNAPNPEKFPKLPITISWDEVVNELTLENGIATIEFDKAVTYDSKYNISVKILDMESEYTLIPVSSDFNNFAQLDTKIKDANENDVIDLDANVRLNEINVDEENTYKNGIAIDKDITIDGHGHTINATDANGNKVRIFNIEAADVTLKNMILTSGSVSSGGAAIYINGGSLTLINVTVIDHQVTGLTGAALSANNAEVTIINSSFINNTLTKTDTNSLGGGAAIYLNGGLLNVNNTLFEGNRYDGYSYSSTKVGGGGGAIYTTTATTNIENSRFIRNSATRTGGSGELVGGALLIKTGVLKGNVFKDNTATSAPNTMRVTDATAFVNYNVFEGTIAQSVGGSANYGANWWGTNNPTSVGVTLPNWLVLGYAIDGNEISATLNKLNDGNIAEDTSSIPTRQATITIDGVTDKLNTTNGVATVILDKEITVGISYDANVTIDSQTVEFTIKPIIADISTEIISNASIGINGTIKVQLTGIEGIAPTETVSLWLNDNLYSVNLDNNGVGTIDLGYNLGGGLYDVYVKYNGDTNYAESEKIDTGLVFEVVRFNPTITLDNNTLYHGVGTYIYLNVSNDFTTPTGEITVTINENDVTKELINGRVFIPVDGDLSVGIHQITVYYGGDTNFNDITATFNLNVTKFEVNVTAEFSRDAIDQGSNVTLTVTVTPEGVVYYYDKPLFSIDKTATSTSSLIKVTSATSTIYSPTASIVSNGIKITSPSSGASSLLKDSAVIFPEAGSLFEFKYVSSTNFRLYAFTGKTWNSNIGYLAHSGSTYSFAGKSGVTSFEGFAAPKEGDVFKATIENRQLTFYVNGEKIGTVSVTADNLYFGIYTYKGSTTIVDDVKVDKLGKEPTKATYTPNAPSGNINIKIGSIDKNISLTGGKVVINLGDALTKGTYTGEIKYEGDDYCFNASTVTSQLTIKRMDNATIVIENPEICELGKNITVSVEIIGVEDPITGMFNVTIGDIVKTAYAENGKLTFDVGYNLTSGNYTIKVYYDGDQNYMIGFKNASFIINPVDTTLDVTGAAMIFVGNDGIVSIKVNPVNGVTPSGNVTIKSSNVDEIIPLDNGEATYNLGARLPCGVHDVFVEYNGDVNFNKVNTTVNAMFDVSNVIYVNATSGSDEEGTGFADKPFKSIKKAWSVINGDGKIILNGLFTGSDNIGLALSKSNMINVDIIGENAIIDAEVTRVTVFTITKANIRFINLTFNNSAASDSTSAALIDVIDADSLDIINSTITNVMVQNGNKGTIYLTDYDARLTIANSIFDNVLAHKNGGVIVTNNVNQGLSNAKNKIYVDNSSFTNIKAYQNIFVSSSNRFGAGADVIVTRSIFTGLQGMQAGYSSFIESNSFNISNSVISGLDTNKNWPWISIKQGNLNYNFWSDNEPDFSNVPLKPEYWLVMTFDYEDDVFTATLNTLNDDSAYENISDLPEIYAVFSDNLNPAKVKLEDGISSAILSRDLKVGEEITATIGDLTLSIIIPQGIEGMSFDTVNAYKAENGTVTVNVTGRDDVVPTGNVTIWLNSVPYTANLTDGIAVFNVGENLDIGNYISKAQYNGDVNYLASDIYDFVFIVEKGRTEVSAIVSSIEYGKEQSITFALTSDDATGNFTVLINNKPYTVFVDNPKLDLGILDAGEYTVVVTYNGDKNYYSAENKTSFNVTKKQISPNVSYDDSVKVGKNQTIEVTFEEYDEDAKVMLEINGNIKVQSISNNRAVFEISELKEDNYTFTITYESKNYVADPITKTFNVTKNAFVISPSVNSPTVGNNLIITIEGIPSDIVGSVVVSIDGLMYGTTVIDGNYVASIPTSKVGNGNATIIFNGDDKYEAVSENVDFTVSELEINVEVDKVISSDSNITISAPGATGEFMVIVDDEVTTVPIVNGNATYSLENTPYGSHNIIVLYNGVVCHVSEFTIEKLDADLSASAEPINVGSEAEIIITVNKTAKGSIVVDGKYYAEIDEGSAVVRIPNLTNGTYTFTVKYSGDDKFNESETTVDVVVNKFDIAPEINVNSIKLGEDACIEVTLPDGATGNVTILVDNENPVTLALDNSKAFTYVSDLTNGTHTVKVIYSGDNNYAKSDNIKDFDVIFDLEIAEDIGYGRQGTVQVNLPADATGNVTVFIGEDNYTVPVKDGSAVVELPELDYGEYNATIVYSGDDKYPSKSINKSIFVDADIEIPQETSYNGTDEISITLPEDAGGNLTVKVNGEETIVPVINGTASFPLNALNPGENNITVSYSGDEKYNLVEPKDLTVIVNPNINLPEEMGTTDNNIGIQLPSDAEGNLTVTIDGGKPTTISVVNGSANMTLSDLDEGEHDIVVAYSGDGKYDSFIKSSRVKVSKVTPLANVTIPEDLVAGKESTIQIALPDGANGVVLVDVGGKKYYANVKDGIANVDIAGLSAGEKQLVYEYLGDDKYAPFTQNVTFNVSNPVVPTKTATSIICKESITVLLTSVQKGSYYAITLKDANGNILADKKLELTFNGATNAFTTDKNGIVNFKLAASKVGDYKMTLSFAGDDKYVASTATATVKITKEATKLTAKKKTFKAKVKTKKYTITLKDSKGKAIKKVKVTIKIGKKTFKAKTNAKGKATFKIKKLTKKGTYKAKVKFAGNAYYKAVTKTVKIKVKK